MTPARRVAWIVSTLAVIVCGILSIVEANWGPILIAVGFAWLLFRTT